jgi:hypothetical protein
MFLHVGNQVTIKKEHIIAIIDIDSDMTADGTKKYIKKMEKLGLVRVISNELPKSLIITYDGKSQLCHVSPISVATLRLRINEGKELKNWKRS